MEDQPGAAVRRPPGQQLNPYAAPIAAADVSLVGRGESAAQLVDATTGQRFLTLLLDFSGYLLLSVLIGLALGLTGVFEQLEGIPDQLLGYGIYFAYYAGFEATLGRTPGKFAVGTRVVRMDGGAVRPLQVIGRTFVRFVPFEPFSFLARDARGRWHDRWSKTRVVRTRGD